MFKQVDYVMVLVTDMGRSIKFYRDMLGLPLKFESPKWTEFQTGATALALHGDGIPNPNPASGTDQKQLAGTCSIGFTVENLQKAYEELKAKGVNFTMPPTQREEEGIKLAVCLDPDGLPVSLAEHLQS